ncbi:aldose epimerase family protein [Vannielia litorea]|uniref:Aldose 1-epimerase n=1 Tax=Vannielia litorea TaxID=1217970 RepID=A0A1N6IGX8_9RHOB|nr:aldose epimerase family protein [Vannielia litorea]SIO31287.1 aldose 1-epimerase [Vannielia litorea]
MTPDENREIFATTPEGDVVEIVTLQNGPATARVMTWGATLQDFRLDGIEHSLVLGSPVFEPYRTRMRNYGAIVGRAANRIAGGRAPLNGTTLQLETNEEGRTALHGGSDGCGYINWQLAEASATSARFAVTLADGQGGHPGNLALTATYSLDAEGALTLEITGTTDAPTFCNIAHHSYWNLDGTPTLDGHTLQVDADSYLAVDAHKIPQNGPAPLAGTRFDFRQPRAITMATDAPGLDHNFCLRDPGTVMRPACTLRAAGLQLEIDTTEPGLQVYDGSGLNSEAPGHTGKPYGPHAGVAIEPQHWPDAPNHPDYPQITLNPGQTYRQVSRFHVTRI